MVEMSNTVLEKVTFPAPRFTGTPVQVPRIKGKPNPINDPLQSHPPGSLEKSVINGLCPFITLLCGSCARVM